MPEITLKAPTSSQQDDMRTEELDLMKDAMDGYHEEKKQQLEAKETSASSDLTKSLQELSTSNNADGAVELMYDPVLQCYYDPQTNKYYQLEDDVHVQ